MLSTPLSQDILFLDEDPREILALVHKESCINIIITLFFFVIENARHSLVVDYPENNDGQKNVQ